jgi:hypothetical protein
MDFLPEVLMILFSHFFKAVLSLLDVGSLQTLPSIPSHSAGEFSFDFFCGIVVACNITPLLSCRKKLKKCHIHHFVTIDLYT